MFFDNLYYAFITYDGQKSIEQRAKSNGQRGKTNEQQAKSNEQKSNEQQAESNEQWAKSNEQRADEQQGTRKMLSLIRPKVMKVKNTWFGTIDFLIMCLNFKIML